MGSVNNRLSQIQKTLRQRKLLRDNIQAKKLYDLGLYDDASKLQKPTTEAITSAAESAKKGNELLQDKLELVKTAIETTSETPSIGDNLLKSLVIPLDKTQNSNNKYSVFTTKMFKAGLFFK